MTLHAGVALAGPSNDRRPRGIVAALADGDQRAHERADHRVAERVGTDGRLQEVVVPALAVQREKGADGGRALALLAEGGEVVLAEQWLGGGVHGVDVELARPVDDMAAGERVGRPAVGQPVHVAPLEGGEAGVEAVRRRPERAEPDVVGQEAPQAAGEDVDLGVASSRSTCATWPRACTPASVRPAQVSGGGGRQPQDGGDGRLDLALHRAQPRLRGPAVEPGAVIGEVEYAGARQVQALNVCTPSATPTPSRAM